MSHTSDSHARSSMDNASSNDESIISTDVVIIGAGLSGIGAAVHLQRHNPTLNIILLEARDSLGGTWDLFRYPGIRSDSDMFTLGYRFKPWLKSQGIAAGAEIKDYIKQAAIEYNIFDKIRFEHKVLAANWSSDEQHWQLEIQHANQPSSLQAKFMLCCTGYYDYQQAYQPTFTGQERFTGDIVHPQFWDEQYDYRNKRIVVIGSGATAVTLVPALASKAQKVTMLQRSPSYVMALPQDDPSVALLGRILPAKLLYKLVRARNISLSWVIYHYCRRFPNGARKLIYALTKKQLPDDFDMRHFQPAYAPWDERLCVVPDGDLFQAIREQKADVITSQIDSFEAQGLRLKSGEFIPADLVVSATGLKIQILGNIQVSIDGKAYDPSNKMIYRGLLLEDLPNAGMIFGYTNASWTLKADLLSDWFARLIKHMQHQQFSSVSAQSSDAKMPRKPFVDMSSGYIQRAINEVPKQGSKGPWKLYQNYLLDLWSLKFGRFKEAHLHYRRKR